MNAVTQVAFQPPPEPEILPTLRELFGTLRCRPDITNYMYHADRSCVSSSGLKLMLRSPAHFKHYLDAPHEETPALFIGTAIHARLLEPELFAEDYVVAPESDKRKKEYKEFKLAHANQMILDKEQAEILEGIAQSVSQHSSASTLLRGGVIEHSIIWQDKETGIWCKIRPDCLSVDFDTGICMDVKSTEDASEEGFLRSCLRYDYDLSAAFYLEGLRETFQRDFDFAFLACEKSAPYACALYGAPMEMIERGQRRFRAALRRLKQCRDTDSWPSYQPDGDYSILSWPRYAI